MKRLWRYFMKSNGQLFHQYQEIKPFLHTSVGGYLSIFQFLEAEFFHIINIIQM